MRAHMDVTMDNRPALKVLYEFLDQSLKCYSCGIITRDGYIGNSCPHLCCSNCFEESNTSKENVDLNESKCVQCNKRNFQKFNNTRKLMSVLYTMYKNIRTNLFIEDNRLPSLTENNTIADDNTRFIPEDPIGSSKFVESSFQFSTLNYDLADESFVKGAPVSEGNSKLKTTLVPETQYPIPNNVNILDLDENLKLSIFEELIKNMGTSEISRVLFSNLDHEKLTALHNDIQNLLVDNDRVIEETDPEDLEKESEEKQPPPAEPSYDAQTSNYLDNSIIKNICDPARFVLTSSRLPSSVRKKFAEFCDVFGISSKTDIDAECTHLLMHTNDKYEIDSSSFTFKYLFALLSKISITSHLWIIECLKQGVLMKEDAYVVKTNIVWQSSLSQQPLPESKYLLENCCIFLLSNFENCRISEEEMIKMLNAGKGIVKTSLEEIETLKYKFAHFIAIVNDDKNIDEEVANKIKKFDIKVATNDSMLDCFLYLQLPA